MWGGVAMHGAQILSNTEHELHKFHESASISGEVALLFNANFEYSNTNYTN